ncbi:uncharacterized protein LOC127837105 [Dreissena polymorpha]|nr:uncharacterized protein LOC127837105 [Dreissena polymorpha]
MEDSGRQIGDNRPAASSGIHVDDKDDVSSDNDVAKIWQHNPTYDDMSQFTANPLFLPAGNSPPPHHANFATFKGVQEKPKPFSQMELNDLSGERMRPIQPRQSDVPNHRFDVTMLAEPSETSVSTSRPSSVTSVGQIPKPGPKVTIPLHRPDEFDNMIEQMKTDACLTDVQT